MAKHFQRDEARKLRRQGISVKEIASLLGVSKGSVSVWVRDILLTDAQIQLLESRRGHLGARNKGAQTNRAKFRSMRIKFQEAGRDKAKERRPLHIMGCIMYWTEGAKSKNDLYFVNSDPNMMKLFIKFLREELLIKDDRMTIHIHCHYDDPIEIERIESFWLDWLQLTRNHLKKTQFKEGSTTRKNILVNGVCGLRVNESTETIQHIYGAIQEYGEFENPDWLF